MEVKIRNSKYFRNYDRNVEIFRIVLNCLKNYLYRVFGRQNTYAAKPRTGRACIVGKLDNTRRSVNGIYTKDDSGLNSE